MIEGIKVNMGGKDWIVPPLNLKALRRLGPKLKTVGEGGEEAMGTIVETVHAALQRNYPDISIDEVEDMVDTSNMQDLMQAIMNSSGLKKTDGAGSGEVTAASP